VATVVWFLASAAAIVSALAVIVQRNPFISAIALLGNLASLATLYVLLQSDFVAAAQIIVYAGAVMVMFLFVIAYIGPRGEVAVERRRPWQVAVVLIATGGILVEIALVIGRTGLDTAASVDDQFGSPQNVGQLFLTTYVGAFELVSLLLLVAAIAAVVLGAGPRPTRVRLDERERRVREARELAATRSGGE
jgi:NADH:ubiquinone oxidoreductase subunit 6 (subunit J)